ncbi:MAG: NAD(P)-dependent glycerol-3-phosphate dehydrogenase [Deltaproteobacteria bacterium]|nr:NAD(P)-dependent glycerol-3-phosphate dehydrogenase [Deltaproteobacteria bacterium]
MNEIRAGIIGGGSWGTAIAQHLTTNNISVDIWVYEKELVDEINIRHENTVFLPSIKLSEKIKASNDIESVIKNKNLIVFVTPSHHTKSIADSVHNTLPEGVPIICASKGIENDTLMTMDEVLHYVLPGKYHNYLTYLSGPTFAREVAMGLPASCVVASVNEDVAKQVQLYFANKSLRIYTSTDVAGVELGGAIKNVIAIAAGICDGAMLGNNARAAVITRGLAEMTRLAVKKGANPLTLSGLAGVGDLVLTCTGELSRNRAVGIMLGQGKKIEDILSGMKMVAEGVRTSKSVYQLSKKLDVEMPISEKVYQIIYDGLNVKEAIYSLMTRTLKAENEYSLTCT